MAVAAGCGAAGEILEEHVLDFQRAGVGVADSQVLLAVALVDFDCVLDLDNFMLDGCMDAGGGAAF